MKSLLFTRYGPPDGLRLAEIDPPTPAPDEMRIRVRAASINSWDWELLHGLPFANRAVFGLLRPKVIQALGCDVAGVVAAVGSRITRFTEGDAVFGDLSTGKRWGGFAEYTCAKEHEVILKPEGLSFEQAAALPQAGLLALQGLRDVGQLQPGMRVLINGAGGGTGTFALQLARHLLAGYVAGVDRGDKLDLIRGLGGDLALDYEREEISNRGERYDLILDCQCHRSLEQCARALAPGGRYLVVGGSMKRIFQALALGGWRYRREDKKIGLLIHKANRGLQELADLVSEGVVSPMIDRVFPLERAVEGLRYFGEGGVRGKIIVSIK